jgi:nucleotide-binding universal stress UspA family protein
MAYKILCPTDGSETARKAAAFAAALARMIPGATITVLTVITVPRSFAGRHFYWRVKEQPEALQKEFTALFREEAARIIEETAALLRAQGVAPETMIREGEPAEEIIKCAQEGSFNQIVIGARGFGMISLVLGNVAYKVVQLSPVPVTVVR